MGRMLQILEGYCLGEAEINDERIWSLNEIQGFSVKSMYNAMDQREAIPFLARFIWSKLVPSNISFFMVEPCSYPQESDP